MPYYNHFTIFEDGICLVQYINRYLIRRSEEQLVQFRWMTCSRTFDFLKFSNLKYQIFKRIDSNESQNQYYRVGISQNQYCQKYRQDFRQLDLLKQPNLIESISTHWSQKFRLITYGLGWDLQYFRPKSDTSCERQQNGLNYRAPLLLDKRRGLCHLKISGILLISVGLLKETSETLDNSTLKQYNIAALQKQEQNVINVFSQFLHQCTRRIHFNDFAMKTHAQEYDFGFNGYEDKNFKIGIQLNFNLKLKSNIQWKMEFGNY
ncbi:unnamed protein product [Paramecium octaurelia]|uniref:Uncharacterized protein n=1 Tax=Paramecium octaurelia TaxID=43137 RepID=A0A8S1W088_PAROT|nr:unnamed protein product [Paramecium octaurelia]